MSVDGWRDAADHGQIINLLYYSIEAEQLYQWSEHYLLFRNNPDDELHFGNEVSLKIYDCQEIAYGESRYQIVQQPHFNTKSPILNDRGGSNALDQRYASHSYRTKRSNIPVE